MNPYTPSQADDFSWLTPGEDLSGTTVSYGFSGVAIGSQTYACTVSILPSPIYWAEDDQPPGWDRTVSIDLLILTVQGSSPAVLLYFEAATGNALGVAYNVAANELTLGTITAFGAWTAKASVAASRSPTLGQTYTLTASYSAGTLTATLGYSGSFLASATWTADSSYGWSSPAYFGVADFGTATSSSTTGALLTNFASSSTPATAVLTVGTAGIPSGGIYDFVHGTALVATPNYILAASEALIGVTFPVTASQLEGCARDTILWRMYRTSLAPTQWGDPVSVAPVVKHDVSGSIAQNWVAVYLPTSSVVVAYWVVYPAGYNEATATTSHPAQVWTASSNDEGATWTAPTNVTALFVGPSVASITLGPGNCLGILPSGRMVLTGAVSSGPSYAGTSQVSWVSDDGGRAWIQSTIASGGPFGCQSCVLANGVVAAYVGGSLPFCTSADGESWSQSILTGEPLPVYALATPGCPIGMASDRDGMAVFTGPSNPSSRSTLTAWWIWDPQSTVLSGNVVLDSSYSASTVPSGIGVGRSAAIAADDGTGDFIVISERGWPSLTPAAGTSYTLALSRVTRATLGAPPILPLFVRGWSVPQSVFDAASAQGSWSPTGVQWHT